MESKKKSQLRWQCKNCHTLYRYKVKDCWCGTKRKVVKVKTLQEFDDNYQNSLGHALAPDEPPEKAPDARAEGIMINGVEVK